MIKNNRHLIIGFILGAFLTGVFSFIYLNNRFNDQFQKQRLIIARQSGLIDSVRNSGLAILLDNVLDKINDDLKNNPKRVIRDETIASITALSYECKPYFHPEEDSVSERKLSPERGHLLLVLSRMNLDSGCLHRIYRKGVFAGADLRGADLDSADLSATDLRGADFRDAKLKGAKFTGADLRAANLWGADLKKANLVKANLTLADLPWANLNEADLQQAILLKANLSSAQLRKADLRGAFLMRADFTGAFLNGANLTGADMLSIFLERAHLDSANLSRVNLTMALMTEVNLTNTDLTEANMTMAGLTGAIVSEENWLTHLNEWKVTGVKEIAEKFKLVSDQRSFRLTLNDPRISK